MNKLRISQTNQVNFTQSEAELIYNTILSSSINYQKPAIYLSKTTSHEKIWYSKTKTPEEINKTRNAHLAQNVLFNNLQEKKTINFGLKIFKILAEKCQEQDLKINIPETIIIGYGNQLPVLLYTNERGCLRVKKDVNNYNLSIILEIFEKYRSNSLYKTIGPLAIKREPDSKYNRIIMKQNEIILEWKNSYKVDVILQRFIASKGIKSSKIRVAVGKETKMYRIVNKLRLDLKNTFTTETPIITHPKAKPVQKNLFNEIALENRRRSFAIRNQDSVQSLNINKQMIVKSSDLSILDIPKQFSEITTSFCSQTLVKNAVSRKSITLNPPKKNIDTLNDYFETCYYQQSTKTLEELKRELWITRTEDHDFKIDMDEMIYTNYYRDKINDLFSVSTQQPERLDIFEIRSSKGIENALNMMTEIRKILDNWVLAASNQKVSILVCDFLDDAQQNVYFMKIKNYGVVFLSIHKPLSSAYICPGEYCSNKPEIGSESDFSGQTYKVLKKLLVGNNKSLDDPIEKLDPRLYEKVRVCKACYEKYTKSRYPAVKGNRLGLQLKKMHKREAEMILEEINPTTAADTVKIIPKKNKYYSQTASTKISEQFIAAYNKKPIFVREKTKTDIKKEFFDIKRNEVLRLTFESEFGLPE